MPKSKEVDTSPFTLADVNPEPVDGPARVFGGRVKDLPPMARIPDEFKRSSNQFVKAINRMFFFGGAPVFKLKQGVTPEQAEHVCAIVFCYLAVKRAKART